MSFYSERKKIPNSFLARQRVETSTDSVQLGRALAIIHCLEYFVAAHKYDVVKALLDVQGSEKLSDDLRSAMGRVMHESFCRVHGGVGLKGSILRGAKSVVEEVVQSSTSEAGEVSYSIERGGFQQQFEDVVRGKRKNMLQISDSLNAFKRVAPADFKKLRGSLTLDTSQLSYAGQSAIAFAKIGLPHQMIEAAEELLLIGYDIQANPLMDMK